MKYTTLTLVAGFSLLAYAEHIVGLGDPDTMTYEEKVEVYKNHIRTQRAVNQRLSGKGVASRGQGRLMPEPSTNAVNAFIESYIQQTAAERAADEESRMYAWLRAHPGTTAADYTMWLLMPFDERISWAKKWRETLAIEYKYQK